MINKYYPLREDKMLIVINNYQLHKMTKKLAKLSEQNSKKKCVKCVVKFVECLWLACDIRFSSVSSN